jgi:hypothetical protein
MINLGKSGETIRIFNMTISAHLGGASGTDGLNFLDGVGGRRTFSFRALDNSSEHRHSLLRK